MLLCYVYATLRGRASGHIDTKKVGSLMVLSLAQLGDTVSMTPIFHQVKAGLPQARVLVAAKPGYRDLLAYNNDIDEFVPFEEGQFWRFLRAVRRLKIDVAILPQASFLALAALYLAGVRHIIAIRVVYEADAGVSSFDTLHNTLSYRMLCPLVTTLPLRVGYNMLDEHLTLLRPLGIVSTDTTRRLGHSAEAGEQAMVYLKERGVAAEDFVAMIFPASGNKAKNWVAERFAEVALHLHNMYGAKVVVIGGPGDTVEVSELMGAMPTSVVAIDASGAHHLDMLKALIARANLFISADAGPMHIAVAFGVPTIDILGPAPDWVAPKAKFVRAVSNRGDAEPAMHPLRNREFDFAEARRQAEAITAAQVIAAVDELLAANAISS